MTRLALSFSDYGTPQLERTAFRHPLLGSEIHAVRGKTSGAYAGHATFQWTPAVQALSILILRYAGASAAGGDPQEALLLGGHGSPASSLDYALGKEPAWILDVFGVDSRGNVIARRLIRRTNPERKRPGPVVLAINPSFLPSQDIVVQVNESEVKDSQALKNLATSLETEWTKRRMQQVTVLHPHGPSVLEPPQTALVAAGGGVR